MSGWGLGEVGWKDQTLFRDLCSTGRERDKHNIERKKRERKKEGERERGLKFGNLPE